MNQLKCGMHGKMQFSMGSFDPKEAVEDIAGSFDNLKKLDVYRVLDKNAEDATEIADYIKEARPDLVFEVEQVFKLYGKNWV